MARRVERRDTARMNKTWRWREFGKEHIVKHQAKIIRFGDKQLSAELALGEAVSLRLRDAATGRGIGESPLLTLEVCDSRMPRVEYVSVYRVLETERTSEGVHLTVYDPPRDLYLGIWLAVRDGELRVVVPPAELRESRPELYRLFAADVLPNLMACGAKGSVFLPLQSGCVFRASGQPEMSERFMIYGDQERWELNAFLPVCAVNEPAGGLMALAVQGAADMRCNVSTDGRGAARVNFAAVFREQWPAPMDYGERELVFTPLAKAAPFEVTVAKRLRRHVMEDLGKPTIKQRAEESPQVAYLLKSYIMKLFFGIQQVGAMMNDRAEETGRMLFKRVMTFDQALAGLRKLKKAGVEHVLTQSVGWNIRGHDGLWPTRFPVERRLGGEAAFRALIKGGRELGYHMTIHDNCAAVQTASPDFNPDQVVHSLWGGPRTTGYWGGGVQCFNWGLALTEDQVSGAMRQVQALGLEGAYYLDGMGSPLMVNYHPEHRGPRSDCARGYNRFIETATTIFGGCGTELGHLYCTVPADSIVSRGGVWQVSRFRPEWPISRLKMELVPVWQLALHGLVITESHGEHWKATMECLLYGDTPRAEWSAEAGIMPVLDDTLVAAICAKNELCVKRFGHLATEELVDWKRLGDQAQQTTFADGTVVEADFTAQRLTVNKKPVERPQALHKTAGK